MRPPARRIIAETKWEDNQTFVAGLQPEAGTGVVSTTLSCSFIIVLLFMRVCRDEARYIIIGESRQERLLLVSYTERDNATRLSTPRIVGVAVRTFAQKQNRVATEGSTARLWPKLTVNTPGDVYEQEADRAASRVLRMTDPQAQRTCPCGGGCPTCGATAEYGSRENGLLQPMRAGASGVSGTVISPPVQEVLNSPGQPLDDATRTFFEPRFGQDFGRVRLHTDSRAAEAARSVNALAFTVGRHVVLGKGHDAPESHAGRKLLAHELAHVLQQGRDESGTFIQRQSDEPEVEQRLGMLVLTYPDAEKVEATVNQPWTAESGIGSTIVGMAEVTGLPESTLISELVTSGAYTDEEQVRLGFIVGTRVVAKEGAVDEISVRGKVFKAGGKFNPSFEDFLNEGVQVFRGAGFGLCSGEEVGRDKADAYDARYWVEDTEVPNAIRALIPAWDAMDKLVRSIGKDVPKAGGGGTTRWSFDCYDAAIMLRLYAIWRTSSEDEFNSAYNPLIFGLHAATPTGLGQKIFCDGPREPAYHWEGAFEGGVSMGGKQVFESKSMEELADEAPVGSLIAFGSLDIQDQCRRNVPGAVCAFQFENTIKLGPDRFWAHPFGAVTRDRIHLEMANAAGGPQTEAYFRDTIYISAIRYPL